MTKMNCVISLTPKRVINSLLQILTFFLCCEILYSPESGSMNLYILLGMSAITIALVFMQSRRSFSNLSACLWAVFILWTLLYGDGNEPVRYALTWVLIFCLSHIQIKNLRKMHILLILLGSILTIETVVLQGGRGTGYMHSPTIFSLQMCVSVYYLLENRQRKKYDFIYCILAFVMTFFTYSRTNLLAAGGLLVFDFLKRIYQKSQRQIPVIRMVLYSLIAVAALVAVSMVDVKSIMNLRDNAQDSTNTRLFWIAQIWNDMSHHIWSFFIGMGGGYTSQQLSSGVFVPMHQDFLMFLCEYGVPYLLLLCWMIQRRYRLNLIEWMIIVVGSFHNFFISSVTIILFFLSIRELRLDASNQYRIAHSKG